jgi:nucleotide sugar dehydrogenase
MKGAPKNVMKEVKNGKVTIAVIGLGWMGLPLACLFADKGAKVIGVDINQKIVDTINRGVCPNQEPNLPNILKKVIRNRKFRATRSLSRAISRSQVIFITVPTSVDNLGKSDYTILEKVCKEIGKKIQKYSLVILESTVAPTITERVVKTTIEKHSGLKAGMDFGLAHSPIRAMGGNVLKNLRSYNKIVGANDKKSLDITSLIHSVIVEGSIIKVKDLITAEASKIFETVYRDVNIALANELAMFCEKAKIDFMEAKNAANTQPYSNLHTPSIGVGGHCLPIYPHMLLTESNFLEAPLKVVKEGRKINEDMPKHVARLVANGLRTCGKTLKRSKVTILGISYRPDIKEVRFSPSLELIKILERRGCRTIVYDPMFSHSEIEKMGFKTETTLKRAFEKTDCVVIAVAHKVFKTLNPQEIAMHSSMPCVIVDGAHILNSKNIEKLGMIFRGIGRGIWDK